MLAWLFMPNLINSAPIYSSAAAAISTFILENTGVSIIELLWNFWYLIYKLYLLRDYNLLFLIIEIFIISVLEIKTIQQLNTYLHEVIIWTYIYIFL